MSPKYHCRLCHRALSEPVAIAPTPFFWGYGLPAAEVMGARMHGCPGCGLVQLEVEEGLRAVLERLYTSTANTPAAVPSAEGWGIRRVREFFEVLDLAEAPQSVLEIGCHDGYLLSRFLERGSEAAVGVEPARVDFLSRPGLEIVNDFFSANLLEGRVFDLVYAVTVLDHIEDLGRFMADLWAVTRPGGTVMMVAPNCERALLAGDFCLFLHEHVNYFTPATLTGLFRRSGFGRVWVTANRAALYGFGLKVPQGPPSPASGPAASPQTYQVEVERHIAWLKDEMVRIRREKTRPTVALYGVNHGAVNLCHWGGFGGDEFLLFDSDPAKWGQIPCGLAGPVHSPAEMENLGVTDVFIVPYSFQDEIRGYLKSLGLAGMEIHGLPFPA